MLESSNFQSFSKSAIMNVHGPCISTFHTRSGLSSSLNYVLPPWQGFLVESKLTKLLAPLERDEQSLMKLDAIFAVRRSDHGFVCLPICLSVCLSVYLDMLNAVKSVLADVSSVSPSSEQSP